jgi:hypothetical protein
MAQFSCFGSKGRRIVIFPTVPNGIVQGKHLCASIRKCPLVQKNYYGPIKLAPSKPTKKKKIGHKLWRINRVFAKYTQKSLYFEEKKLKVTIFRQ